MRKGRARRHLSSIRREGFHLKFALELARRNIRGKPFRTLVLGAIVMILSFTLFAGAYTILSLRNGLKSYETRLGADIVVVPNSANGHGTVDDIFLQGITGNYYIAGRDCDKVCAVEGIDQVTRQFFLTSAKASCCSTRVQIIGFDPETDFSVQPWIGQSYSGTIGDGDIVVGSNINMPETRKIKFYGQSYNVAAQLAETGTGLDSAVFTNMATIKEMAKNAANLLETSPFQGVSVDTAASAILIKVKDGYTIGQVTDDINIHITKVNATAARTMISDLASGLDGVARVVGILVAVIWILAVLILVVVFALLSNERKKEFAVLRLMGASRSLLSQVMSVETSMISGAGALIGLGLALLVILPLSQSIHNAVGLPFLSPGFGTLAALFLGALAVSIVTGLVTALAFAKKITGSETGLLLREDA